MDEDKKKGLDIPAAMSTTNVQNLVSNTIL